MKWLFMLLMLGELASPVWADAGDNGLETIFDTTGAVWKLKPAEFPSRYPTFGFRWESANKHDTARTAQPGLTFAGLPVFETLASFEPAALRELTVSLYNRGDAGALDEAAFQKLMQQVDDKLTAWIGMKGIPLKTQERTASVILYRKSWIKEPHRIDLVWSYSEKSRSQGVTASRPEFARLQITRFDPLQDPRKSILATGTTGQPKPISALELRSRVKRDATGDVLIPSVPMVDQGQKGYCAAAVSERVLRYYDRSLDQHEIAQLANTTAAGGTRQDQMVAALRRISTETRMDITVLHELNARMFLQMMADYNRTAKNARKPEVVYQHQEGHTIYLESPSTVYQKMDPTLLKEICLKHEGPMAEFKTIVAKYINNGVPLVWGCVVGIVKEKPDLQGMGGHMRLIIGYNDRTREILYTDTWGAGHELKRLSLADAWTITTGLYALQPREVRF